MSPSACTPAAASLRAHLLLLHHCVHNSSCCIPCPALSSTTGTPATARAPHSHILVLEHTAVSCSLCTDGQAGFSWGHSNRLVPNTHLLGMQMLGTAPLQPVAWEPAVPGLEGGCSSSATPQIPGKHCPKTQPYLGTQELPPGSAASFHCCPIAALFCGCLCKVPAPGALHAPSMTLGWFGDGHQEQSLKVFRYPKHG